MTKNQEQNEWGLTEEQAEKVQDFVPNADLSLIGIGEKQTYKIKDEKPREVTYKDKNTGDDVTVKVINAYDALTGMEVAIWLNSISLRREFYKIAKKHNGNLKDVTINIMAREYEHERYGKTRAYTVFEDETATVFDV